MSLAIPSVVMDTVLVGGVADWDRSTYGPPKPPHLHDLVGYAMAGVGFPVRVSPLGVTAQWMAAEVSHVWNCLFVRYFPAEGNQ